MKGATTVRRRSSGSSLSESPQREVAGRYSSNGVKQVFCELRVDGVLRSSGRDGFVLWPIPAGRGWLTGTASGAQLKGGDRLCATPRRTASSRKRRAGSPRVG